MTQFLTTLLYSDRIVASLGRSLFLPPEYKSRGGGTPHMKGAGMLVGNFELSP